MYKYTFNMQFLAKHLMLQIYKYSCNKILAMHLFVYIDMYIYELLSGDWSLLLLTIHL